MSDHLLAFFLANTEVSSESPVKLDDANAPDQPKLLWKVVLRTGTWKLRPGPGGIKLNKPLKVLRDKAPKGHISLSALKASFDAGAKENVTIPTVHADGTISDSGFVRKLVIQDVAGENGSKDKQSLLWAGMEITEPDILGKIERKSLVGVSGGVLFDYQRTEDAKKFPQILSHVMVTNSPWIGGTGGFKDKLPEGVLAAEDSQLPMGELELGEDEEYTVELDDIPSAGDAPDPNKTTQPDTGTVVWKPEEGYQFARGKVQISLDEWRRSLLRNKIGVEYNDMPYYHVEDIAANDGTSGKALICSGYGNEKEAWVANYNFNSDGDAEVDPFMNWTVARQEWVAASEEKNQTAPAAGRPQPTLLQVRPSQNGGALRVAQQRRAERLGLSRPLTTPSGGPMGKITDLLQGVELSEEQRAALSQHEADEAARDARLEKIQLERKETRVKSYLDKLDDLNLGDPGIKAYVRNVMTSDDDEPALNFSEVTESGSRTEPKAMTASQIIESFIDALPKDDKGKVALSTQARKLPDDPKPDLDDETGDKPRDIKANADAVGAELAEFGLEGLVTTPNGGN